MLEADRHHGTCHSKTDFKPNRLSSMPVAVQKRAKLSENNPEAHKPQDHPADKL